MPQECSITTKNEFLVAKFRLWVQTVLTRQCMIWWNKQTTKHTAHYLVGSLNSTKNLRCMVLPIRQNLMFSIFSLWIVNYYN